MSVISIGTPSLCGDVSIYYANGIAQVFEAHEVQGLIFRCGEPHQRARNGIVNTFLASPSDVLVFIDADIGFTLSDWLLLMEGDEDLVCARYLRKRPGPPAAVNFGLGFARIHRRVFEALDKLEREDGSPLLLTMRADGESFTDYFPQGIDFEGRWRAEDHAFWALAAGAGCNVRVENRTQLVHTGTAHFVWRPELMGEMGPDGNSGSMTNL